MWQRRTFQECASELIQSSELFRQAYMSPNSLPPEILASESKTGIELLKILALSVRPEQDYCSLPRDPVIGALKARASREEFDLLRLSYTPPYSHLTGFTPLDLRDGLNKVAHADPRAAGFYVDATHHDLLLTGTLNNNFWIAVLSVIDLCDSVLLLPDRNLVS